MATKLKAAGVVYESKTEYAQSLYRDGKTVAEVTRMVPEMGYAFAYGIASRMPHPSGGSYAQYAAKRKATKSVKSEGTTVRVQLIGGGSITVDRATGAVKRSKK